MGFDEPGKDLEGAVEELLMDLHQGSSAGPSHRFVLIVRPGIVLNYPIGSDHLLT